MFKDFYLKYKIKFYIQYPRHSMAECVKTSLHVRLQLGSCFASSNLTQVKYPELLVFLANLVEGEIG